MKYIKFIFVIIVLIYSANFCLAQEAKLSSNKIRWTKIYDEKLDFSILFPSNLLIDNEEQKDWFLSPVLASLPELINTTEKPSIIGRQNSVSMDLKIFSLRQVSGAKDYLWRYVSFSSQNIPYQDFKIGNFVGRVCTLDKDNRLGTFIAVAIENKIIIVSAHSKKEDKEIYEKFLQSLKLNDNALFKADSAIAEQVENNISISDLQTSPEILQALNQKTEKRKFKPNQTQDNLKIDKDIEFSRPLIILRQPRKSTYLQPREKFNGIVKVKVEFLSNGEIGDISILSDAPKSLLKKLFAEIQEIKFLPAEVNGEKINLVRLMEYHFNIK